MKKFILITISVAFALTFSTKSLQAQTVQDKIAQIQNDSYNRDYANNTVNRKGLFRDAHNIRSDNRWNNNPGQKKWGNRKHRHSKKLYKHNNGKHKGWYKQKKHYK